MHYVDGSGSYNIFSRLIHWATALLVFGLLYVGFYMTTLEFSEDKLQLYALHKSFGLLVLALTGVRVFWRVTHTRPKPLPTHKGWERILSHIVHIFLYFLIFAMPVSGWVMSSAGDFSIQFFGINLPDITKKDKDVFEIARIVHEILSFTLILIVILHVIGALKHHFIDRDKTLCRMTIKSLSVSSGVVIAIFVAAILIPIVMYAYDRIDRQYINPTIKDGVVESLHVHDETHSHENIDTIFPPVTKWSVDLENSIIKFVATQYKQNFDGSFKIKGGDIFFDENNLSESKVSIKIDIASIKTGSDDRDNQAISDVWFNTESFPIALFEAESFSKIEENKFLAKGKATIRGIVNNINLPFTLKIFDNGSRAEMIGNINLKRLDYGVGQGEWSNINTIGDDVKINIIVHAFIE